MIDKKNKNFNKIVSSNVLRARFEHIMDFDWDKMIVISFIRTYHRVWLRNKKCDDNCMNSSRFSFKRHIYSTFLQVIALYLTRTFKNMRSSSLLISSNFNLSFCVWYSNNDRTFSNGLRFRVERHIYQRFFHSSFIYSRLTINSLHLFVRKMTTVRFSRPFCDFVSCIILISNYSLEWFCSECSSISSHYFMRDITTIRFFQTNKTFSNIRKNERLKFVIQNKK